MTDDINAARRRNQAFVRAQRKSLGLSVPDEPEETTGKGIAHLTIPLSQMTDEQRSVAKAVHGEEWLLELIEETKKVLRKDIQDKGCTVDTVKPVRLLNGDVEVRAEFTQRRRLDS